MKKFLILFLLFASPLYAQVPGGDFHAWFLSQVASKPFGQQTLLELAPRLPCVGSKLTPPNAEGERTKIWDPTTAHWTRVGFGEGHWVWIAQAEAPPPVITSEELLACGTPAPIPQPVPIPSVDFSGVLARLDAIIAQNERIYADDVNRLNALGAQVKALNDKTGLGDVFGNRYAQVIIAAIATYLTTHQLEKP